MSSRSCSVVGLLYRPLRPPYFFFNDTPTSEIYTLSLHDALPISFCWGSAYAAAKAGMLGLTRVTAAEAARKGVRVNALCPGPVTETQMSKDLGATLAKKLNVSPKEQLEGFLNTVLQGRGQTANEIARAALV